MIRSRLFLLGPILGVLAVLAIPSAAEAATAKKTAASKNGASKKAGSKKAGSKKAGSKTPASTMIGCRPAEGAVARTICASPEYRAMEREIAALTDRAKTQLSLGEQSQLAQSAARFVRQRNGCAWAAHHSAHPGAAIDECIRASLETRVKRLRDVVERKSSEVSSR